MRCLCCVCVLCVLSVLCVLCVCCVCVVFVCLCVCVCVCLRVYLERVHASTNFNVRGNIIAIGMILPILIL